MIRVALLVLLAASGARNPLAGRVAGPAADCVDLDRVQGPDIRAGVALYPQNARRVWRLDTREPCRGLALGTRLVAEVQGRKLCRGDRLLVLPPGSPAPVDYCRVAGFTPFDRGP